MTIGELIVELSKLDQAIPVVGESETCAWDIEPDDLVPYENVYVYAGENPVTYKKALILGYHHR